MFQSPSESSTQLAVPEISASERLLAVQELAKLNEQNPNGNDDLNTASKRLEVLQALSKEYTDACKRLELDRYGQLLSNDEIEKLDRAHRMLNELDREISIAASRALSEISLPLGGESFQRSEFRFPKRDLITWIKDAFTDNDSRFNKLERSDMRSPRMQFIWDKLTELGYDFHFEGYLPASILMRDFFSIKINVQVPNFKLHE